jgi:hypothetical protein
MARVDCATNRTSSIPDAGCLRHHDSQVEIGPGFFVNRAVARYVHAAKGRKISGDESTFTIRLTSIGISHGTLAQGAAQ